MTTVLAVLFAQSLLGELSHPAAKAPEPVVAPYAEANVEANAAVMAAVAAGEETPVQEAPAEENPPVEGETEEAAPEAQATESAPLPEPPPAPVQEQVAPETEKPVEEDAKAKKAKLEPELPRSVKITSERTDYDRREGVIMFDKDVFVDDQDYKMHSDQLYVFLDGTNELKRIVAIGNVSITNETRVGTCAKAAYTKSVGKVVMYGDASGVRARLADYGKRKSEVEGRKITFWIDSEQVEVEGSTVTLDAGGLGGKDGAKKLLGK